MRGYYERKKEYIPFKCGSCSEITGSTWHGDIFLNCDEGVFEYVLIQCSKCMSPNLVCRELNSFGNRVTYEEFEVVFPRKDTSLPIDTPQPVASAFCEATMCLENKAYTASVLMCRKTIEMMCRDQLKTPAKEKPRLNDLIQQLGNESIFDSRTRKCLDNYKDDGNDAGHRDSKFNERMAEKALHGVRALLGYVYSYELQLQKFENMHNDESEDENKS